MSKTDKTKDRILAHIAQNGKITTAEANLLCTPLYYCNGEHHIQACLSRLVKNGTLKREQRGVYSMAKVTAPENQTELWDK